MEVLLYEVLRSPHSYPTALPGMADHSQATSWSNVQLLSDQQRGGKDQEKASAGGSQNCHMVFVIVSHWPELIHMVTPSCEMLRNGVLLGVATGPATMVDSLSAENGEKGSCGL